MAQTQTVTTQQYINALRSLGYSFKVNDCDDTIEVNGERLTDLLEAKIKAEMRDKGFNAMAPMLDAMRVEALRNRYHPIKDYLHSLKYDGGPYIEKLSNYFHDKHNVFPIWLRKWLIGAVAKVLAREQNPMLVLDGGQDLGKSYFAKWLAPADLRANHFIEQSINPDDKDTYVRLIKVWIWEVAELQATTRKADREALKHIITQGQVNVRKSYDRYDTVKPALSSFVGTVNNDTGLLSDPTGSRRFLICHLTEIDWSYATDLEVDDIWAEAYAAYISGESWKLTPDEIKVRNTINAEYEMTEPVEEMLLKHFYIEPGNKNHWTSSIEIMQVLEVNGLTGNQRSNMMTLAQVLTKLGCEKGQQGSARTRGYFGVWQKF